jgi:hypothetical protein
MTDISITIQHGRMSSYQTLELNLETTYITAVMDENNCEHKTHRYQRYESGYMELHKNGGTMPRVDIWSSSSM